MELIKKKKRLNIVWLCRLNLNKYKDRLNISSHKGHPCPWITYLLEEIIKQNIFDLHVITTSSLTNRNITFSDKNVTYHVISRKIPFYYMPTRFFRYFPILKTISNYFYIKKSRNLIRKINPDLINSHGTENEDSLPLLKNLPYPTVTTIQGFYNSGIKFNDTPRRRKLLKIENRILKSQKNFVIRNNAMKKIITKYNPDAGFYYHYYPINGLAFNLYKQDVEYDSDIVFAAGISPNKGIEDLISALLIIKSEIQKVKLKIIGFGNSGYIKYVKNRISKNNLDDNVIFIGYIENHDDVLIEMKKSKICVLPTYFDTSPGTVMESMALEVPVISYNVDGLPYMISNNYSGILVEKGNIDRLSLAIIDLLKNTNKRLILSKNAKIFAERNFRVEHIVKHLNNIYCRII